MRWLIERGRPAEASDIAWGLKYFWLIRGYAAEGLQWCQEILNMPSLPPVAELRALEGAAVLFEHFTDHIDRADIVISSTGAPHFCSANVLIPSGVFAAFMSRRALTSLMQPSTNTRSICAGSSVARNASSI